jgi:hypothetical protein
MQKSPWGAVLRSALLPGWGQVYNESYIKAPIVLGGITALIFGWKFYNKRYVNYRNTYNQIANDKTISGYVKNNYKSVRDFYRDQRDLFSIYIGLAYLLNLVDAYVDAELFDFNVQEDSQTHLPMLGVKLNF